MTSNETTLAIIKEVADKYGVTLRDMFGHETVRYISKARHAAFYEVQNKRGLGYAAIGRVFGRDHSTVIHGIRVHKQRMEREGMMIIANTNAPAGATAGLI